MQDLSKFSNTNYILTGYLVLNTLKNLAMNSLPCLMTLAATLIQVIRLSLLVATVQS